jgi:diguanylate cyclase (GGDEF)-like protein
MPDSLSTTADLARQSQIRAFANPRDLHSALAASEQSLRAALRRIELLLGQRSHLQQEVTRLEHANARAFELAFHDELTGLPNRTLLQDRFSQAIALAVRQGKQVALLFLDLDRFKSVNDAFGHVAGDRLLQQVAARLAACIRTSDTACRYGGDEFVVLLPELEGRQSAIAVEEKILAHLTVPYLVGAAVIELTTSIGIALYPDDGTEYGELIRVSDLAMYRNKGCGGAASTSLA